MPRYRPQTAYEIEASMKGVNKFQDPEHTELLRRQSVGRRLAAANLGQLNIPEKPYSENMSSRDYEKALDKRMNQGTRRTTSALSYATSGYQYPVNTNAVKKAVRDLNDRFSYTPEGKHDAKRIEHLRKEMLKRRDVEQQQILDNISMEQQRVVDERRRRRAKEGDIRRIAEQKLTEEGWGGGYKMGLLARIMNIKKKAAKAKAAKAKPTARKPTKRPTKPTRPVVRRRKPTGVRK
jgi:transposase